MSTPAAMPALRPRDRVITERSVVGPAIAAPNAIDVGTGSRNRTPSKPALTTAPPSSTEPIITTARIEIATTWPAMATLSSRARETGVASVSSRYPRSRSAATGRRGQDDPDHRGATGHRKLADVGPVEDARVAQAAGHAERREEALRERLHVRVDRGGVALDRRVEEGDRAGIQDDDRGEAADERAHAPDLESDQRAGHRASSRDRTGEPAAAGSIAAGSAAAAPSDASWPS